MNRRTEKRSGYLSIFTHYFKSLEYKRLESQDTREQQGRTQGSQDRAGGEPERSHRGTRRGSVP
ncbi:hypothetical protein DU43_14420 [Methanosarcina mazei]|uniref:Uncharacterized protein n=1 Tax=Methanosarcina mazei TaxID=2209 RepID=A0A0F8JMA9_METMZ|nr:hypothetical protein [Methanosarcina mazei]KKG76848.1 hypothetical protein DU43_14420 [Methanosarcina mazei]